jgi:hypothetical protein
MVPLPSNVTGTSLALVSCVCTTHRSALLWLILRPTLFFGLPVPVSLLVAFFLSFLPLLFRFGVAHGDSSFFQNLFALSWKIQMIIRDARSIR